jgi:hypothetical protein
MDGSPLVPESPGQQARVLFHGRLSHREDQFFSLEHGRLLDDRRIFVPIAKSQAIVLVGRSLPACNIQAIFAVRAGVLFRLYW